MKETNYGGMNAHTVGGSMKDIAHRAMTSIWTQRVSFIGEEKIVVYKSEKDRVTNVDKNTQKMVVRKLEEYFPGYGMVCEEENEGKAFKVPCTLPGQNLFFTVDPLDGTKAFERKQSSGFGPMISLCTDTEVIAVCVGDAMTHELYYFRPESEKVHRLNFGDHQHELLAVDPHRTLKSQYCLSRENPLDLPEPYNKLVQPVKHGGLFKDLEIAGSGIGIGMSRLWKGEVGAYVVRGGKQTPWDLLPVWGMSKKLGFVWLYKAADGWHFRNVKPSMEMQEFEYPTIIIHSSRVQEFMFEVGAELITSV